MRLARRWRAAPRSRRDGDLWTPARSTRSTRWDCCASWRQARTGRSIRTPLFGLRLLVHIALRSLSSAIDDPISAVQAIGGVHELLHSLIDRDLDIGRIADASGDIRVVLDVPG